MRATIGSDDIFKRDFSAPTGEDRFDKSMLPKVMQVSWGDGMMPEICELFSGVLAPLLHMHMVTNVLVSSNGCNFRL